MKKVLLFLALFYVCTLHAQNEDIGFNFQTVEIPPERSWAIFTDLGTNTNIEFNLGFEYFHKPNRSLEIEGAIRHSLFHRGERFLWCHPISVFNRYGGNLKLRYNIYKSNKNWDWTISPGVYLGYHYFNNYTISCFIYSENFHLYEDVFTLGAMYKHAFNHKKLPYLSFYFNAGFRAGVNNSEWRVYMEQPREIKFAAAPILDLGIRFQFIKFKK